MTKPQKRARLYMEWLLAYYGNNECWYDSTLWTGIPDGEDPGDVIADLTYGFYDDDLDGLLELYTCKRAIYERDGYYIDGALVLDTFTAETVLRRKYNIPEIIIKKRSK